MVFTGYEREHLEDGPYQADKPDLIRHWAGSANQRFHFLTNRYRHLEQRLAAMHDRLELWIAPSGSIAVNKWAPVEKLGGLLEGLTRPIGRGQIR